MIKFILLIALFVTTPVCGVEVRRPVVLPNPALLGCRARTCSQLWQEENMRANAAYPRQVIVDIDQKAVTAFYNKSVSLEDLKASINERYPRCLRIDDVVKVWRVEKQKFAIYLSKGKNGNEVAFLSFRDLKFQ